MFLFCSVGLLHAYEIEKQIYKDAASMGMGGVGVSTIGYSFSPVFNPAALGLMYDHDVASFIGMGVDTDLYVFDILIDKSNLGSQFLTPSTLAVQGPISLGYMGKGFGIWTTSSGDVSFVGSSPENSSVSLNTQAILELTVNLAYGYRIPFGAIDDVSGLSLGATLRFSQRFKYRQDFQRSSSLVKNLFSAFNNSYSANSFSSDFGMSLRVQNWIFGVTVRDALSTGYEWKNISGSTQMPYSKIPFAVDFGTSYHFNFTNPFIQRIAVYLEFYDAHNQSVPWIDKLRLGAEMKFFNFLILRTGLYESFVTGGVGLYSKWVRLDFAYYREKYQNFSYRDHFFVNFVIGLDNPSDKKGTKKIKKEKESLLEEERQALISKSVEGLY